jgi:MOSC domain-containing protein YiiM
MIHLARQRCCRWFQRRPAAEQTSAKEHTIYHKEEAMSQQACVVQINVNSAGGVPKHPVARALLTYEGVQGDRQNDRKNHGGPLRAVSLYAIECIDALRAEGHPISAGSTGENITLRGLDWATLKPGDRLIIGERVRIEITNYVAPCKTIAASFSDQQFKRVSQKVHPGWSRLYARVLIEGTIHVGDAVDWDFGL